MKMNWFDPMRKGMSLTGKEEEKMTEKRFDIDLESSTRFASQTNRKYIEKNSWDRQHIHRANHKHL